MSIINPNRYIPRVEWSFSEFSDKNYHSIAKTLSKKFYFDANELSTNASKIAAKDQAQFELIDLQDKLLLEKIVEKMRVQTENSNIDDSSYNIELINAEFASYGHAVLIDSLENAVENDRVIITDAYDIVEKSEVVDGQKLSYLAFEKIPNKKYQYTKFAG